MAAESSNCGRPDWEAAGHFSEIYPKDSESARRLESVVR